MYAKILSTLGGALTFELAYFSGWNASWMLGGFVVLAVIYSPRWILPLCFLIGGSFSAFHVLWIANHQLSTTASGGLFWVEGTVTHRYEVNAVGPSPRSFVIDSTVVQTYNGESLTLQNLRLSSFGQLRPERYAKCAFYARLKLPRGTSNPGGVNREIRYFVKRVSAIGYVIEHPSNLCMPNADIGFVNKLRAKILDAFAQSPIVDVSKAVLKSLAVADRSDLSEEQWLVFQRTGTAHLLAISGLHVGLVATLVFYLVRTILLLFANRLGPTTVYRSAMLVSVTVCVCYAGLAGFSLPTQRALVVVMVSMIALLRLRSILSYETLLWSALAVVLLDPLSMMTIGFWMSFSAVAILVMMRATRPYKHWLLSSTQTHCYLSLGTLPLVILINETLPISAPLANFIAVPITCFVIVPLVLLGVVFAVLSLSWYEQCWQLSALIWEQLWLALNWLSTHSPMFSAPKTLSLWQLGVMALGILMLLLPAIPKRWLFVGICAGQLLLVTREPLSDGEWRLTTLDVGQGLAVIIETAKHVMVYDTGPAFGNYNAGASVVVPALRYLGYQDLDLAIISHADNDHAGGLSGLMQDAALKPSRLLAADPKTLSLPSSRCEAGQVWRWDDVELAILAPFKDAIGSDNDLSCVLKLTSRYGSALLPGDIEAVTESTLVELCAKCLQADILIAPHHGSRTSSTPAFVQAVAPKYVVFASGYANRFDFPHPAVVERYLLIGAKSFVTGIQGAVKIVASGNGMEASTQRVGAAMVQEK